MRDTAPMRHSGRSFRIESDRPVHGDQMDLRQRYCVLAMVISYCVEDFLSLLDRSYDNSGHRPQRKLDFGALAPSQNPKRESNFLNMDTTGRDILYQSIN